MSSLRLFGVGVLATLLFSVACARHVDQCWVCQREIDPRVRVTLTLADGKNVLSCCPRCALHYKEGPGNTIRRIAVTDYATGIRLPFDRAFVVEGSDETPCIRHHPVVDETRTPMQICFDRCLPSLITFGHAEAARAFMADHGGTLYAPGTFPGVTAAAWGPPRAAGTAP